jgi:uncharacterized protein (TIGR03437 family)
MGVRLATVLCSAVSLLAANPGGDVHASQAWPVDIPRFSPGQIVTVEFFDVPVEFREPLKADSRPLPIVLGGLMVLMHALPSGLDVAVPLLAVAQERCGPESPAGCTFVTHVTLQIPFSLFIPPRGSLAPVAPGTLVPVVNGVRGAPVRFMPSADSIHIQASRPCEPAAQGAALICNPAIAHADGRIVSDSAPAVAGETITISAVGLGRTIPEMDAGAVTPDPAPAAAERIVVTYDFGANGPPRLPATKPPEDANLAIRAALAPGEVGVYHITIAIPEVPAGTPTCGSSVRSNLTITIFGRASADGAGICVGSAIGRESRP